MVDGVTQPRRELPRALVFSYVVPGNEGRLHKVFWFDAADRSDLSGTLLIRGCCDCTGYFIEVLARGRDDYICPHMTTLQPAAEAEFKRRIQEQHADGTDEPA